jgi:hypothetical protein
MDSWGKRGISFEFDRDIAGLGGVCLKWILFSL